MCSTVSLTELKITTHEGSHQEPVLEALADPTSRRILDAMSDQPMTASEVADNGEIPLSTVYRKLNRLADTSLVSSNYRFSSDGKHPRQYQCAVDRIHIHLANGDDETVGLEEFNEDRNLMG